MTAQHKPHPLKGKLLVLMVLRVVLALAFLGVIAWSQMRTGIPVRPIFNPLYTIVAAIGFLTILYAVLLARVRNLKLFAYVQLTVDVAIITVITYVTGGMGSSLYFLSVIGGSILLDKRGGFYAAGISSIAYGVLIDLEFYGLLPEEYRMFVSTLGPSWENALTTIATNILALFTVAYLTGYLAERAVKVERKLEEKEVDYERLEKLSSHIAENIPTGIMTLDERSRITSFNRAATELTGYSLQEAYFRDVDEIFPDVFSDLPEPGHKGVRIVEELKVKSGEELHLGFNISRGEGGDMDRVVIFQDLTQMKAMEERLRRDDKLKALGELSTSIAHEIRNPLASISGSIQVLKKEMPPKGNMPHLMEIVLRETERLDLLISDFLLFARPASKTRELVDICEVIRDTIGVFGNSPDAVGIDMEDSLEGEMFVEGDRRQITQVFWNLFLNAARAMPDGGRLVVESGPGAGAGSVEITVRDTGAGISAEDLSRVFDPFFSTRNKGTGLGLAIVHRIVESHGGSVVVESVVGEGAAFKLTLPLVSKGRKGGTERKLSA
ncbi:MAG: ATP-binding protein [Thermodesulfobacteriota bacterium]